MDIFTQDDNSTPLSADGKATVDMHLTESLIGVAGNVDMTISQIKDERLSKSQ